MRRCAGKCQEEHAVLIIKGVICQDNRHRLAINSLCLCKIICVRAACGSHFISMWRLPSCKVMKYDNVTIKEYLFLTSWDIYNMRYLDIDAACFGACMQIEMT